MNNQMQTSLFSEKTQKQILSLMFAVCLVIFLGTSGGNLSGSVGQSKGSSDRQWVDNASSIVGTESVDIDVDGKQKMEGSLIANIDKDGKDAGNLDIKAGSIETKDLQNFDNNKETGFNLAESYGPPKDGSNDGHPNGTTTIGLKNKGYEKEGVTKATIGQGNIETADGSDISGINRDIDNASTITRDQITGALDGKLMLTGSWADTIWTSPNSALGLAWGVAGMPFGAEMHYDSEKGSIYFTNNPLGLGNSAMTLGEVVNYYNQYKPYMEHYSPYNRDVYINVREHENTHVDQARELGPLYLPVYGASWTSILWGRPSFLENQADKRGEVK